MIEANKFRLGLFVILGVILFLVTVFFLGLSEIFTKKARFVTLFRESVQGLEQGSPVKYKGVPIGSVRKITIRVNDKLIRVDMDVNLNAFVTSGEMDGHDSLASFYAFCRKERKLGLRCQLQYAGITGMKYVELDYFSPDIPDEIQEKPLTYGYDFFYIPSKPSILKDILKLINDSLEKISKIKFEEISSELASTIKSLQKIVSDPKLLKTIDQLEKMSCNLEESSGTVKETLSKERINEIMNQLNGTLKSLNELINNAKEQIKGAKIAETSDSFREAADSVSQARMTLSDTLSKLNQTLDAVTELVNYLNDDPTALISGKQAKALKFPLQKKSTNKD